MVQAFKRGELDYIRNPSAQQFDQLKALPGVTAVEAPSTGFTELGFNTYAKDIPGGGASTKALRDPAFRDALGYAIDKQALLDKVYHGKGTLGTTHGAALLRAVPRRAGQPADVRHQPGQAEARCGRLRPRRQRPAARQGGQAAQPAALLPERRPELRHRRAVHRRLVHPARDQGQDPGPRHGRPHRHPDRARVRPQGEGELRPVHLGLGRRQQRPQHAAEDLPDELDRQRRHRLALLEPPPTTPCSRSRTRHPPRMRARPRWPRCSSSSTRKRPYHILVNDSELHVWRTNKFVQLAADAARHRDALLRDGHPELHAAHRRQRAAHARRRRRPRRRRRARAGEPGPRPRRPGPRPRVATAPRRDARPRRPPRPRRTSSSGPLLLVGGVVLVAIIAVGLVAWRGAASRRRREEDEE